jgi:hypothetical protein
LSAGSVTTEKLALGSVGTEQLSAGSVTTEKLALGSVGTEQLSAGSVTIEKLAPGIFGEGHISAGSVTKEKLAHGSVGEEQLSAGSVTMEKLAPGSVGNQQIAAGSITPDKLAPGLLPEYALGSGMILSEHIADCSISNDHIQERSIELSALSFTPVITCFTGGVVKQMYGLSSYSFSPQAEQIEVIISFEESFADDRYVMTVTTDNPACYAVIHSKAADKAAITIIRTRISHEPKGSINWIAIGQ